MYPKCLKCVILCLESLFSYFGAPLTDVYLFGFHRGTWVVSKFKGAFLFHPKVLAAVMALDVGSRT